MKATITSTDKVVLLDKEGKVQARVWEGLAENGVRFTAYIALVQVNSADDNREFERQLQDHKAPSPVTARAIDMRMIL